MCLLMRSALSVASAELMLQNEKLDELDASATEMDNLIDLLRSYVREQASDVTDIVSRLEELEQVAIMSTMPLLLVTFAAIRTLMPVPQPTKPQQWPH